MPILRPYLKGRPVVYNKIEEQPITTAIIDSAYDPNIQIPAIMSAYRVPGLTSKDATTMEMISAILSGGASSKLYKKMVDEKKNALQVGAINFVLEDYGAYITYALPNNNASLPNFIKGY